jgi:hypothetical protein
MMRSRDSMSAPMRARCCMSITSGCVCDVAVLGLISEKAAPVTTSIRASDTSDSINVKPASESRLGGTCACTMGSLLRLSGLQRCHQRFVGGAPASR